MPTLPATISLRCRGGSLFVTGWPTGTAAPPGLSWCEQQLVGPARLRAAIRHRLAAAGQAFVDSDELPLQPVSPPAAPHPINSLTAQWLAQDRCGLFIGLPESRRIQLLRVAAQSCGAPSLLLVPDSAAAMTWQENLDPAAGITVLPVATAALPAATRLPAHELLAMDAVDMMPARGFEQAADGSPARWRLGFAANLPAAAIAWQQRLGPLLGIAAKPALPPVLCDYLPLPPQVLQAYAGAWHRFLAAFDRWSASAGRTGFAAFVQQARRQPELRAGLQAWHEAAQLAAWHDNKSARLAALLARHRDERLLLFTPDRATAYAIAKQHWIAPITAELSPAERRALLQAFANGELRALAGPRLLDLGVAEGSAAVGIMIGGPCSRAQRQARLRRIHATGLVYELISLDTLEVGRAQRASGEHD